MFPGGLDGKESTCRRPGFDPWVGKMPWRRERLPTAVFWPGEFHGRRTPGSPWGHKESNMSNFHTIHFLSNNSPIHYDTFKHQEVHQSMKKIY